MIKGISDALFSIFSEGKHADKVVPVLLKAHPEWGSRDRRFVAENIYDIVRWWRYYWAILDKAPAYDPLHLAELVGVKLVLSGYETKGHPVFEKLDPAQILARSKDLQNDRKIRESIPDWLDMLGQMELGENWEKEIQALNKPAGLYLRVNLSKISVKEVIEYLNKEDIAGEPVDGLPSAIWIKEKINLENNKLYKDGLFEIQDGGSQLIAPFLDPLPGELIVDACAGAGGKTLHLADLVHDQAKIVAMDTEAWKLDNLLYRAKKAGLRSITVGTISTISIPAYLKGKADRLLLDVPCSGLGVLKRNPDTKWKLNPEQLKTLQKIQQEILQSYSSMLKPGGKMVYATCSILPSENEKQVRSFLNSNPGFSLLKEYTQLPSAGFDGFYMACVKRNA